MTAECPECNGHGLIKTATGCRECGCQEPKRRAARLIRAGIPHGFRDATMENFKPTEATKDALRMTKRFLHDFIPAGESKGLLLTGTVGTGKTHLAAAALRNLVETKGVEGRFVDVRALLDRLRSSYDDEAQESQEQILRPIFKADLVVIDELGAARPSDWVFETLELLIGGLYNKVVPVIVTTNLPNLAAGATARSTGGEYARAATPETLGDRIGSRMWSRLQQMCVSCEMIGPDWRGTR